MFRKLLVVAAAIAMPVSIGRRQRLAWHGASNRHAGTATLYLQRSLGTRDASQLRGLSKATARAVDDHHIDHTREPATTAQGHHHRQTGSPEQSTIKAPTPSAPARADSFALHCVQDQADYGYELAGAATHQRGAGTSSIKTER